jgi:pimeloyl-ACP methyl ester carboxylesterase
MKHRLPLFFVLLVLCCVLIVTATGSVYASPATASNGVSGKCITTGSTNTLQGTLEGANYTIQVPANWNGTLVLYSHGYTFASLPIDKPAPDASDVGTATALLQSGYALAGSSYSQNGWALQQAFHDQITLLNYFNATCGKPVRTIAWGDSLGGIITAGLVQLHPNLFAGALPMCGVLAGGVGTWNQALDSAYAFDVLLAGNKLPVVNISSPLQALQQAEAILTTAQKTPQGRARIALAAALNDLPGWYNFTSPEPASNDYVTQEQNQYLWESQVDFLFAFVARAELEARAGGNPSWNNGVDYHTQLKLSIDRKEVVHLYEQAGLKINADLDALNAAPRIYANQHAVDYLRQYIVFNGDINVPVLTIHTTGDGLVVNEQERAYRSVVNSQGDGGFLRHVFIHRAGHCSFTPAERLTALATLVRRIDTGKWGKSTAPTLLNQEAASLGSTLNPVPPAFIDYSPTPFLRPYDVRNEG